MMVADRLYIRPYRELKKMFPHMFEGEQLHDLDLVLLQIKGWLWEWRVLSRLEEAKFGA